MPRRRWYLTVALGLYFLAVPAIFHGDITDVQQWPDPPILVGYGHDYIVVADAPTGEYRLHWRCAGDPPGDWVGPWFQSDPWFFTYETHVGAFDDVFWAEEEPDPEGPLVWNYKEVQTTVLGPDNDEVASGLDIDSDGDILTIYFRVRRGDDSIGPEIAGDAEEQLVFYNPQTQMWSQPTAWVKAGEDFHWDSSLTLIYDSKAHDTASAGFQARNVGDAFLGILQHNRLVVKNCAGNDEVFTLSDHYFEARKTGANTYKYVELPVPQ